VTRLLHHAHIDRKGGEPPFAALCAKVCNGTLLLFNEKSEINSVPWVYLLSFGTPLSASKGHLDYRHTIEWLLPRKADVPQMS
jgi:hypothetical protein